MTGFEPATSWTQIRRTAKLCYIQMKSTIYQPCVKPISNYNQPEQTFPKDFVKLLSLTFALSILKKINFDLSALRFELYSLIFTVEVFVFTIALPTELQVRRLGRNRTADTLFIQIWFSRPIHIIFTHWSLQISLLFYICLYLQKTHEL